MTNDLIIKTDVQVMSEKICKYIERYNGFLKKTAKSVIELGLTIIEAEENLDQLEMKMFCDEVGLVKGMGTYKKLAVIGKKAARFEPYMDKLPNTWTTIYKLAQLKECDYEKVTEILSPFMKASAIDDKVLIKNKNNKNKGDEKNILAINWECLDEMNKAKLYKEIAIICQQYHVKYTTSDTNVGVISAANNTLMAAKGRVHEL